MIALWREAIVSEGSSSSHRALAPERFARPTLESGPYPGDRLGRRLVLPDSNHGPTELGQAPVRVRISGPVPRNLGFPVIAVGGGLTKVPGTAMPKTPVDEHRDPRSREGNIDRPTGAGQGSVADPVSQSDAVQERAKPKLG